MSQNKTQSENWNEYVKQMENSSSKPNILLLMTDQQRFDTLGAAGFGFMKTPNLDRLVEQGCLFTNAYSPNPICIPARHNLITGLPARYHGFAENDFAGKFPSNLPELPKILSDNGYETRAIGKMHFRPVRRHHGFDKMELMEEVPEYREQDEYAMYLKQVGLGDIQNVHGVRNLLYMLPQRSLVPNKHHGTTWVTDRSIDFIKNNRGRHPFFLWSSWIAPHPPFNVVDEFADLYKDADLPEAYTSTTPLPKLATENRCLGDLPNEKYVRRMRESYYAAISHVDYNIGRILDTLEENSLLDNTVIIFISDHGELLGDYGIYQKWLPYDSCSRVPFIVRYPEKFKPGTQFDDFVDLNDVMPTILDCAGIDFSSEFELAGESLCTAEPKKDRSYQYIEYGRGSKRWISIRNKSYKYNYYYGGGNEELFDLLNDPHETCNLLYDEHSIRFDEVKNKLKAKLLNYESKYGLHGYVEEDDFVKFEQYKANPCRNRSFPIFPHKIQDETEKSQLSDFVDEIKRAVEKEPVVKFDELDLKAWQTNPNVTSEQVSKLKQSENKS